MSTADGRVRPWVACVAALLVAAAVTVASLDLTGRLPGGLVTDAPTPTPTPAATGPLDPPPVDAPDVLQAQPDPTSSTGSLSASQLPVAALEAVLGSGRLGPEPGALVLDVETATTLLDRSGDVARTPASVAKLATGAAVLVTLDPLSRLRTQVVAGEAPGELVLVGAGDTTLTSGRTTRRSTPRDDLTRASLADLADATASAVAAAGLAEVVVKVDDSLFDGPAVSPDWPASYVGSGEVSPVSALSVDAGRVTPSSTSREADPALAAGQALARLLEKRGLRVAGEVGRTVVLPGAEKLAEISSPTVAELVELMLSSSDNDLAESLFRLVAVGAGLPGTFADGSDVVAQALLDLGVPIDGLVLLDGSGLARGSSIAPETLARLLVVAADGTRPALGPLVSGLPVAGFSGTLSLRFGAGRAGAAAGLVRAKTGTLTGVSTLAGLAPVDGRPVVFVLMSDQVPADTLAAQDALDRFAATLVGATSPTFGTPPDGGG